MAYKRKRLAGSDMVKCDICGIGIGVTDYGKMLYEHDEQEAYTATYKHKEYTLCLDCKEHYEQDKKYIKKWHSK